MTTTNAESFEDDYGPPPGADDLDRTRRWRLPLDNRIGGAGLDFEGRFLGFGSSHRDTHINHEAGGFPRAGTSCSGCRWLESRIFRRTADGWYLLYTVGESVVPGEEPRYRGEWIKSPYEIIDSLTTFRTDPDTQQRVSSLSYVARRVLAQAAFHDGEFRDAYEGRVAPL